MSGRNIKESFSAVYPGRPIPSKSTILSVVETFKSTGCVNAAYNKKIRPCTVENEENKENIFVEVNPLLSVRSLAQELYIGRETCKNTS